MIDEDNLGFIKIHRKILKWEWYTDVPVKVLFIHCLILANHKPKNWRGTIIERGQFISSYGKLAIGSGLSVRQVRTALGKLKSTQEVTSKTTNKYTMITVSNYSAYHINERSSDTISDKKCDNQTTIKRQSNDNQMTTTKNVKNVKNVKNKDIYLDLVKLTKEEHEKLEKKFGKKGTEQRIWNLNDYGHRKIKRFSEYTDHYRTILDWARREENEKNNSNSKQQPVKKASTRSESKDIGRKGTPTKITIED